MDVGYVHRHVRTSSLENSRITGILIAVPFVVCFSLFGIFNLVGGTMLTIMACSSTFTPKAKALLQRLMRRSNMKIQPQINPVQVVGIILLLTGSLLVVIGLTLGVVACRSVNEHQRRRNERQPQSGIPLFSLADKSSRQTSSSFSMPSVIPSRTRNDKRSLITEKTVFPILEVDSEEGSGKTDDEKSHPVSSPTKEAGPSTKNFSQTYGIVTESREAESQNLSQSSESLQSSPHQVKVIVDIIPEPYPATQE